MQNTETTTTPPHLKMDDINSIRNLLPYDWRIQIASATGLTERQVSEVFYLRTTNPEHNKAVWMVIKRQMKAMHQTDLVDKIKARIASTCIA